MVDHEDAVVVGVHLGTHSGQVVVVRVSDGEELGSAVHVYPPAVPARGPTAHEDQPRRAGWPLQVPGDYLGVLRAAVPAAIEDAGVDPARVVGIGTAATAATMVPTTADGTPLCELETFAGRPHAYATLGSRRAARGQAERITALAHARGSSWVARPGGISAEDAIATGLQLLEEDPVVYAATEHWVQAADWIVWRLTGTYVRNGCTAGHRALHQEGTEPDEDFLAELDPRFRTFVAEKLAGEVGRMGHVAGRLTAEAAAWTGLPAGIAVPVGSPDTHVTAAAAAAVDPGQLVATTSTSACHVRNGDDGTSVPGVHGLLGGGAVEGRQGYAAGRAAVGDIVDWYVDSQVPVACTVEADERGISVRELLTEKAAAQQVGAHGLVALDWDAGHRSVPGAHELSGLVVGLTPATRPEEVYRALLEATAFGTRTVVEAFADSGVPVSELVVAGGQPTNRFLMQLYSDVTRLPLSTIVSEHAPALGSAIHAAVAAGAYPDVRTAARAMGRRVVAAYTPDEDAALAYDALFAEYRTLQNHFSRGGNDVMDRLRRIRGEAVAAATRHDLERTDPEGRMSNEQKRRVAS